MGEFELGITLSLYELYAVISPFEAESLRKTLLARCAHILFDPAFSVQRIGKDLSLFLIHAH